MNMKRNVCVMIATLIPGINGLTRLLILKYFEMHNGVLIVLIFLEFKDNYKQ